MPTSVIKTMFVLSDSDCSGSIDVREFKRFYRLLLALNGVDNFEHEIFLIADRDCDEIVQKKEIQAICKLLGWQVPKARKGIQKLLVNVIGRQ